MEKISMKDRALRVILSGAMVVSMTPIVMAAPTITGAEQAQVALAAEEQSTTIATPADEEATYTQDGFKVTFEDGAFDGNGGCVYDGAPMVIESTDGKIIAKVELTLFTYQGQNNAELTTTTKGTLSGNTSGSTLVTCSGINDTTVEFATNNSGYYNQISQVKIYYTPAPEPEWQTFGGCQWSIDDDGTLTIQPAAMPAEGYTAGQLPDNMSQAGQYGEDWPWYANNDDIKKVVVVSGVKAGNSLAWMFRDSRNGYKSLTEADLSGLDFSNVVDMSSMFGSCHALTKITWPQNLDTSKVTTLGSIFLGAENLDATTRIGYMKGLLANNGGTCTDWTSGLFASCPDETIDLSSAGLDMSKFSNMSNMFSRCENLTSITWPDSLDTSNVANMMAVFTGCSKLSSVDLSKFDTSNVTLMLNMFSGCSALTSLDMSSFDTSNVTNMSNMFYGCSALTTIVVNKDTWSTAKVLAEGGTSAKMFKDCTSLVGGAETAYDASHTDATYARIDGGTASETPGYLTQAIRDIADCTIDPIADQTYTGKALTPAVIVKDGDKTLIEGTDYVVSYKDNVNVGTATGSVVGIGSYAGTKDFTFKIVAAADGSTTNTAATNSSSNSAVAKTGDPLGGMAVVAGGAVGTAALALALKRRRDQA